MIRATKKLVLGNKFTMKNHIKNGSYRCEFDNLLITIIEKKEKRVMYEKIDTAQ